MFLADTVAVLDDLVVVVHNVVFAVVGVVYWATLWFSLVYFQIAFQAGEWLRLITSGKHFT